MARYFERTWSHGRGHRLYDSIGARTSTLPLASPRPSSATTIRASPRPSWSRRCASFTSATGSATWSRSRAWRRCSPARSRSRSNSVFFGNSGTEAVEGALKLARRATGRPALIGFEGAFHGRTYGSLSLTTSNPNYQRGHGPLLPGVYLAPYPNAHSFGGDEGAATADSLQAVERLLKGAVEPSQVAAVLIEPELGEGGYIPAPIGFLQALRELCDRHGILLVADEIQTGYGRTGRMWGFEHAGIVPDVVCAAKGIANGLPLGAIVARRELHERWGLGAHGSTFGGNLVACAAGIAVLETIEAEDLIANAAARGEQLTAGLREIARGDERITDVRGRGLMIGVELTGSGANGESGGDLANRLLAACADAGLLVLTCGVNHDVIRWLPPLDVTADEIDEGLGIFGEVLRAA